MDHRQPLPEFADADKGTVTRNSSWLPLRSENDRFLAVPAGTAHPIAGIKKGNEEHETNENDSAGGLQVLQHRGTDRPATDCFKKRECDVTSVKHRKREHIQQSQVNVNNDTEPKHQPPAIFAFKKVGIEAD